MRDACKILHTGMGGNGVWLVAKHNGRPQMFRGKYEADGDDTAHKQLQAAISKQPLISDAASEVLYSGAFDANDNLTNEGIERCEQANLRQARGLKELAIILPLDIQQFASVMRMSQGIMYSQESDDF